MTRATIEPFAAQDKAPFHGSAQAAWDFIDEIAALAAIQADLIRHCAEQGDKPGAAFAARRLRACVRAIGETIKEELS